MNILMFVMTMLMLLTVLTYAKIDSFRSEAGIHIQFENYMQHVERKYINEQTENQYCQLHITKEIKADKNDDLKKEKTKRNTAKATLPIGILFNSSTEAKSSQEYQYTVSVLKGLINRLYGEQRFFEEARQERPDIVDEVIVRIGPAVQEMGNSFKINKAKDLANLDLNDPFLNEFFYKMLKGASISYEDVGGNIVEEGYPSLLKYIDSSKGKKIRVYLAPKPLLQVLFDPVTADEIITTREYFFREVTNGNIEPNSATERFESMFVTKVNPSVPISNLDFSVSKTSPKTRVD